MAKFLFSYVFSGIKRVTFLLFLLSLVINITVSPTPMTSPRNSGSAAILSPVPSLTCDFEAGHTCGYTFIRGWKVTTGIDGRRPEVDHTRGKSDGHYIATMQNSDYPLLISPTKEFRSKTCLTFFYYSSGRPVLLVYINHIFKLLIRPINANTWKRASVQLDVGIQSLSFLAARLQGHLALDSFSTSTGLCPKVECDHSELPCPSHNTTDNLFHSAQMCIPQEYFCDGEIDCPGMMDEQNCNKCDGTEFSCFTNDCIPQSQRCDCVRDCYDSSDEYLCFVHKETNMLFLKDNEYLPVCETNLNTQDVANKLCSFVGKRTAKIGRSGLYSQGIEFTEKWSQPHSRLFQFGPTSVGLCNILNVTCVHEDCGVRSENLYEPVIQDGIFSSRGQWPWQVLLMRNNSFVCSGTLISSKYVLTAAHCIGKDSSYSVAVGSLDREAGERYGAKRVVIHPQFNLSLIRNDVAMIELDQPVQITDYVRPACLPSKPWLPGVECYITGWGREEHGLYLNILKKSKVYLLDRDICKAFYRFADQSVLCANNRNTRQPGCYGDSGGPLVCRNEFGYWEVVGVASFGKKECKGPNSTPSAFADVYTLLSWIEQEMTYT